MARADRLDYVHWVADWHVDELVLRDLASRLVILHQHRLLHQNVLLGMVLLVLIYDLNVDSLRNADPIRTNLGLLEGPGWVRGLAIR